MDMIWDVAQIAICGILLVAAFRVIDWISER